MTLTFSQLIFGMGVSTGVIFTSVALLILHLVDKAYPKKTTIENRRDEE